MITFQPILSVSVHDNSKAVDFEGRPPDWVTVKENVNALVLFPFHYFFSEDVGVSEHSTVFIISQPFEFVNPELAIKIDINNYG